MTGFKTPKGLNDREVVIIEAGEKAREQYGCGWGSTFKTITSEQIEALMSGKQLAFSVMDEYVVFIEKEN